MITNIRKRQLGLNKKNTSDKYAEMYNIVRETHNLSQANTIFNHILELDHNLDNAVIKSVDLLLELYDTTKNIADVDRYRHKVLEAVPTVRDAVAFKNHIQRKIALHKGRLQNKINNKIDDVKDKVNKTAEDIKKKIGTTPSNDKEDNTSEADKAKQEALNMIYHVACENVTYDRIVRNYNKISKRFDFDKIVYEKVSKPEDAVREAYTVSKLIDTYSFSDIDKFKITTENYLFVLGKNGCEYDTASVIEAVADYFLINGSDSKTYLESLYNTLNDMANYSPLKSSSIGKIVSHVGATLQPKEDMFSGIDTTAGKIDKLIGSFKLDHNGTDKFTTLLTNILAVGGLEIYLNTIGDIINVIESLDKNNELFDIFIDFNTIALSNYDGDPQVKLSLAKLLIAQYEKYKARINKDVEPIIDDICNAMRFVKESYDQDEMNPLGVYAKLCLLYESLKQTERMDVNRVIKECAGRMSVNYYDCITNSAIKRNSIVDSEEFKSVLQDQLDSCRSSNAYYKDLDDYVRIDCIKYNLNRLNNKEEGTDEVQSLDEAIIEAKAGEVLSAAISDFNYYPTVVKEMDIVNTMNMAVEKVKDKIKDVDQSIISLGRGFDSKLEELKNIIDSKELESEDREAVISGKIVPKASRIIKLAITSGAGYFINPAISVIVVIGYLASTLDNRSKERRIVLDEIDVELEMCKRYLKKAEDDGNLEKQRELLKIKKKLESQKARLTYNMIFKHGETTPNDKNRDDD